MATELTESRSNSQITGKDLQTVAAGAAIGTAVDVSLYVAADIVTGGLFTLGGIVAGIIVAANDRNG